MSVFQQQFTMLTDPAMNRVKGRLATFTEWLIENEPGCICTAQKVSGDTAPSCVDLATPLVVESGIIIEDWGATHDCLLGVVREVRSKPPWLYGLEGYQLCAMASWDFRLVWAILPGVT